MSSSSRQILRSQENVTGGVVYADRKAPSVASSNETLGTPPGPPKPPRSAFMCFTDVKKREIMSQNGITQDNDDILKIVAREWRALSDRDRAHWDEEARNDKVRFVREKAKYTGPWPIPKRRAKKHPLAPKRPMSAFLKYSQTRRAMVKHDNPDMSNTDVSRLLGEMWRNASDTERAPYVEQEEHERALYKDAIKKFREQQRKADAASRTSHESVQKMSDYKQQVPAASSSTTSASSHHHPSEHHHRHHHHTHHKNDHRHHHHQYLHHTSHSHPSPRETSRNVFDSVQFDSFEEPTGPVMRGSYSPAFAPYNRQHHGDVQEKPQASSHRDLPHIPDPLPISEASRLLPPPADEDDSGPSYQDGRTSYYFENLGAGSGYYFQSRYP